MPEHACTFYCCPVCHLDLRDHSTSCEGPLIFQGIVVRGLDFSDDVS